jgi:putative membrane protein
MQTSRLKSPMLVALFAALGASMLMHSMVVHPQDASDKPSASQGKESVSGASSGASTQASDPYTGASSSQSAATSAKLSASEEKMLKQLAEANVAEINAGKLAQDKAQSAEVKSFAKKMVDDHTKALDDLKQLAQTKAVTLPTELNKQQMAMEQKLQSLSGEKFDIQYMKQTGERSHKQTYELLQKAAKAEDTDLKNYASKTIAAVEGHQQMVKETERSLKGMASGKSGAGTAGSEEESSGKSGHAKSKGVHGKAKGSGGSTSGSESTGGAASPSGTSGGPSE